MDLVPSIYHEKQEPGSMLCAQHALNNLLQASLFTPQDLADMARQLDALEAEQLDDVPAGFGTGESPNYDDSGFFSIMVLEEALKVLGLRLVRWQSQEMVERHENPELMEGFVLNHQLHWFTIRRFATQERFYNLDSCIPQPAWISPTYLGMSLREAENSGYSIFAVLRTEDSIIAGLPDCLASDLATTLPPPSSANRTDSKTAITKSFAGKGNILGTRSSPSIPPIPYTSKRRTSSELSSIESDRSVRPRLVSPSPSSTAATDPISSLARQSTSPEPVERRDVLGLSEDDQLALAIADSLQAANLESQPLDSDSSSDDEVEIIEETPSKGKGKGKEVETEEMRQARSRRRGELEEEAEFEAALKASLEDSTAGIEKEEEEEEDEPSVEEMRRRRLARFG